MASLIRFNNIRNYETGQSQSFFQKTAMIGQFQLRILTTNIIKPD